MTTTIIWTIVAVTLLGLLLAVVLFLVAKKFKVEEDPRIDEVEKVMPGANCGGCGFAGCRAFEVKEKAPMVAVVRCNGTCENRPKTNVYDGYRSCKVMAALYTGDTGCAYGCLGCGDCVAACQFGAISMDPETGLPVVDEEKCTGCGACAKACPKKVIELRNKGPKGRRVFVSCVNMEKGAAARKACKAACIGCGKCEKECPFGAITVEHNVAYIDFNKCKLCRKCVVVCPTGAIHDVNFPTPAPKPAPKPAAAPVKPAEPKAEAAAAPVSKPAPAKTEPAKPENKEE